jgi:phage-related minor tail protein
MANKIKGLTIEIAGETTLLQKSMADVNTKTKDLKTELKDVERLLKLDPGNTDLISQKQKILADTIGVTADKLSQLKEAEKQVQEQFEKGEVSEEQFRQLQREVIKTESELKKLEQTSKEFGTNLTRNLQSAGKSMQDLGSKVEGAGNKLAPISAVAGGAIAGIIGLGVKAAKSADDINTLAKQTGLSTDEIQKFMYASEMIDVPLETLTGSMAKLTKNMGNAKEGTGAAAEAFAKLGVSIKDDVTGELRNNQDVFDEVISKLGDVTNETERDSIAMDIFGKSAQDLNPLILGGADALTKLGAEAEEAGFILSTDALNSANEFNDAMDTLKAKTAGRFAEVGAEIATMLTPMLEDLADVISNVLDWIGSLDEGTLKIILTILALVAGIAPLLIIIGNVISAVGVITAALPVLGAAFAALAGPIGIAIAAVAAVIAIGVAVYENWDWLKEQATIIFGAIGSFIGGIFDGVIGTIQNFINWVGTAITKVKEFFTAKNDAEGASNLSQSPTAGLKGYINGSYKTGLDYVPFDGFVAELHKDEGILTAEENRKYRSGESSVNHTGTIRVEGVNNKGDLTAVVDIVMNQLRREVRFT